MKNFFKYLFSNNREESKQLTRQYPKNEKYWNYEHDNWEINGKPYTYRVSIPTEGYERNFSNIDEAYECYRTLCKTRSEKRVFYEHVPPN